MFVSSKDVPGPGRRRREKKYFFKCERTENN
jgi:hypothetical protein